MKPLVVSIILFLVVLGVLGFVGFSLLGSGGNSLPSLTQTAIARATALCLARTASASEIVLMWEIFGTPTLTPTRPDEIAPTPTPTITPTGYVDTPGDPARGKVLFNGTAQCSSCHDSTQGIRIVGPSLKGIASTAATREPGVSTEAYLRKAIVAPGLLSVDGYETGVMPRTYAQSLKPGQINDLIAYLMTLN